MENDAENTLGEAAKEGKKLVAHAASAAGFSIAVEEVELTRPREIGQGTLASAAAFALAKDVKQNPLEIAKKIVEKINAILPGDYFDKAQAVNGYVNLSSSQKFYSTALSEACGNEFGKSKPGKARTFVIEYSQPNTGKPFHVGHIRSTILGDCVANCLESTGWEVRRINYLGDAGANVAKLLLAAGEFKDLPPMTDERVMLEYYVRITKEMEGNPKLEERARDILLKIEKGDPETLAEVKRIREKSYLAFERNYAMLGVKFDTVVGESEFINSSREIASEALLKQIAFTDKETGALVANLEPAGLPNTILLRSNGTTLYFTRDLGNADWKWEKFRFDESLVTTASEQNTYFRQLIAFLGLLGREYAGRYKHAGFGLVTLAGEKMSSREGRVVFMEDVLNEAVEAAKKEIAERQLGYPEEEINSITQTVGVGSVKFAFLRVGNVKNISFDPAKAVGFDGDTGAYLQYTAVRAKNILRKGGLDEDNIVVPNSAQFNEVEQQLVLALASFPEAVAHVARQYEPHVLCDYLLKLAANFSEFYEKCPVLKAENEGEKQKRLAIVAATENVLQNGLGLLGINVPERM